MDDAALHGVKVVELCGSVAGAYCTRLLADLGAEVIKVEPPGGDPARRREPFTGNTPHPENSGLFHYLNAGKIGVTLNTFNSEGKRMLKRLAGEAEVLVEDRSPALNEEEGLHFESLRQIKPGLVVTSVTPFGQTGPYRDYKTYPLNTFQSGGEGYLTPGGSLLADRPPTNVGTLAGEYNCGMSAAGATLMALFHARATGEGQHVDISKQEALMVMDLMDLLWWPNYSMLVTRATRGFRSSISGVLPCKDGYVCFGTNRWPLDWQAFLELLGSPEWSKDPRYLDQNYCEEHGAEIKDLVMPLLMSRTKDELYRGALEKRCSLAPCYSIDEVANSEQLKARGFFVEVDHPGIGNVKYPTAPYKLSQTPLSLRRFAPALGQHNRDIFCERLGFSEQDLIKLTEGGVI